MMTNAPKAAMARAITRAMRMTMRIPVTPRPRMIRAASSRTTSQR
jgi:hypothetical protein